jgi:hypothetical protein
MGHPGVTTTSTSLLFLFSGEYYQIEDLNFISLLLCVLMVNTLILDNVIMPALQP